jgi:hypothetical protein
MPDLLTDGPLHGAFAGLEARLRSFFPASHFGFGVVSGQLTPDGWRRLVQRTPWVGIGFRGVQPDPNSARAFKGKALFTVFVCVKNERSPAARLSGDAQGPGVLGMVQVATLALQGHELRDIGHIEVTNSQVLQVDGWRDEAAELVGIEVTVNFALTDFRAQEDFLRLGVQWDFEPPLTEGPADTISPRDA